MSSYQENKYGFLVQKFNELFDAQINDSSNVKQIIQKLTLLSDWNNILNTAIINNDFAIINEKDISLKKNHRSFLKLLIDFDNPEAICMALCNRELTKSVQTTDDLFKNPKFSTIDKKRMNAFVKIVVDTYTKGVSLSDILCLAIEKKYLDIAKLLVYPDLSVINHFQTELSYNDELNNRITVHMGNNALMSAFRMLCKSSSVSSFYHNLFELLLNHPSVNLELLYTHSTDNPIITVRNYLIDILELRIQELCNQGIDVNKIIADIKLYKLIDDSKPLNIILSLESKLYLQLNSYINKFVEEDLVFPLELYSPNRIKLKQCYNLCNCFIINGKRLALSELIINNYSWQAQIIREYNARLLGSLANVGQRNSNVEVIEECITMGADVNIVSNNSTPLLLALYKRNKDLVYLLIACGANVNTKYNGLTALMLAIYNNYYEIVELLLKHPKLMINVANSSGRTALMLGANFKNIVRLLVTHHKLDINAQDKDGMNTLMLAASMGNKDVVKMLLAKGANINARSNKGITVIDMVKEKIVQTIETPDKKSYQEILNLLEGKPESPQCFTSRESQEPSWTDFFCFRFR